MARRELEPGAVEAFRRRLTTAAMHLFADKGYDAVTMRGVGDALGVSAMTPYRYVAGKTELFALVRAEAFRRFAGRLEQTLAEGPADPLEKLVRLKQAYVQFALDEPDAYRIMFELRQESAKLRELAVESRRAFGALHCTVAEAVEAGRLAGDPLTIAHLMWASTHGLVSLHLAGKLGMGRSLRTLAAVPHELAAFLPGRRS